jgi:acyl-CoA thioesterase-2
VIETFEEILRIEKRAPGLYRAATHNRGMPVLNGAEAFALTSVAAAATVDKSMRLRSLNVKLFRAGIPEKTLDLAVTVVYDGRSTAIREVRLYQEDRHLASAMVSYQAVVDEQTQSEEMPDVVPPEEISDGASPFIERWRMNMLDFRHIEDAPRAGSLVGLHPLWLRSSTPLRDLTTHDAVLIFVSDMGLVLQGPAPDALRSTMPSTMEQTVILHAPVAADDWLLLNARATVRQQGQAVVRAEIFSRTGSLAATILQVVALRSL